MTKMAPTPLFVCVIIISTIANALCESSVQPPVPQLPHLQVLPSLSPLAGRHLDVLSPGQDGQCARDTKVMEASASNRTLWAIRMLDASAHVPSGVLWGLTYQLGSFDGCMSSGATSPVGSRYCLVSLSPRPAEKRRRSGRSDELWEMVEDLPPHQDAADVLSGEGMVAGSLPLGNVRVGLCVPRACGPSSLEKALQAGLNESNVVVSVRPEHCHVHDGAYASSFAATFFWIVLFGLTAVTIAAPALGWTSWDWREHVRSLSLPDPPVAGIDLSPLSGIRAVNAVYLVTLHRGLHSGRIAISNREYYTSEFRAKPYLSFMYRGALGVDTFFFLAGLLMAASSGARRPPFTKSMINRVVRVLPVYAIVVLFHCTALPELGSGPMWTEVAQPMSSACQKWWWSNLLFLNNYVHGGTAEPLCMEHSWSLAVDMHMFIVGTLLFGYLPFGMKRLAILAGLGVVATVPLAVGTFLGGWPGTVPWTLRTVQGMWAEPLIHNAYTPTHMRAAPYLVGLFAGTALPMLKTAGFRPRRSVTVLMTLLSLAGMVAVMAGSTVFNDLRWKPSALLAGLCAGLAPYGWAFFLATLVTFIVLGEDNVFRSFLSWQPLVTLSRLTFAVYLVSYPLQGLLTAAKRDAVRITPFSITRDALSDNVISFAISFWLFLVLEAPLRAMVKKALSAKSGKEAKAAPHKEAKLNGKTD